MKRIAVLGSTGSIGRSALSVVAAHPERLKIVALAAGENSERLAEQVRDVRPSVVAAGSAKALGDLRARLGAGFPVTLLGSGPSALVDAATHPDVDIVLCASSGTAGLEAALAAIEAGKTLALANKEVLVMAGALMVDAAKRRGVRILPVDSEHNAIHQCLHGRGAADIRRIILTASGGPFRMLDTDALARVTPDDALRHPTWQMGRKITIDSATLMNKGLEVIEARWLFDVEADDISVVVHPQSIVHSMVEMKDGSVIAQLGVTDMRLPIQYAFSYPERWSSLLPGLDLMRLGRLDFVPPDTDKFPCLLLAYDALRQGGTLPIVLNASNELAVEAFLAGTIGFTDIARVICRALNSADRAATAPASIEDVRACDEQARAFTAETIRGLGSS